MREGFSLKGGVKMAKKVKKEELEEVEEVEEELAEIEAIEKELEEKPKWYKSYFIKALKEDPEHPDFYLVKEYEDKFGEI